MNLVEIRFPNLQISFVLYQDERGLGSRQLCNLVPEPRYFYTADGAMLVIPVVVQKDRGLWERV